MQGDFDLLPGGILERPAGVTDRTWLEMCEGRRQSERLRNKAVFERWKHEKKIRMSGSIIYLGDRGNPVRIPMERDAVGNPTDGTVAAVALVMKSLGQDDPAPASRQLTPAQQVLRSGRND